MVDKKDNSKKGIELVFNNKEETEDYVQAIDDYYAKEDYITIKDFFIKSVLDDKLSYTMDGFIEDIINNEVCSYTTKQFFVDIVLDKDIKEYKFDRFFNDFMSENKKEDEKPNYTSKQFFDNIISDTEVEFLLEDLLNHTFKDKNSAVDTYYNILKSNCPYTRFEEEKGKIKKDYVRFIGDILADNFFDKEEIDLEEKTEALRIFEEQLNYNYNIELDDDDPITELKKNQLEELNDYMKNTYGKDKDENNIKLIVESYSPPSDNHEKNINTSLNIIDSGKGSKNGSYGIPLAKL